MKKILIVLTKLYMGGFSKSLINFLLCADKQNDVSFSLLFLDAEQMELEKDVPENIEIIRVKNPTFKVSFFDRIILLFQKYKYAFAEKYNHIVNHSTIPPEFITEYAQTKNYIKARSMQYDFGFAEKYDVVVSWEECFCNYVLTERIPAKRKIGFIHPNYLEAHFCKRIDRKSLKKLDGIITISKSCYNTLCKVFPDLSFKIHYIPNRLNYEKLVSKSQEYDAKIDPSCITLLTVARIVDHDKAVFRIVDLAKKLKEDGLRFKWYIIGNGSDYEEMKNRIVKSEVSDEIILLGEMANPYPYMRTADLFVMQSHREGRPVAVDEALLLGRPALITKYSSAFEQIDDNVTGWIVDDGFNSVYIKVKMLLTNPELIEEAKKNVERIDKLMFENCTELINTSLNTSGVKGYAKEVAL